MKMIDIPPAWLAAALALAWLQTHMVPIELFAPWPIWNLVGGGLVALGLGLMVLALVEFKRARTTPIPHRQPAALIDRGIFALTRNPIYLGDALILAGLSLRWQSILGLLLVPVFIALIDRRFIRAEEARLEAGFGSAFATYASRVRRWL